MTISLYQVSVPVFARFLENLLGILDKTATHADVKKIDINVLLESRLYPDMFPLYKQIQRTLAAAVGGAARLAELEVPLFPEDETSLAQLVAALQRGLTFLKAIKPNQIDGAEQRVVSWVRRGETVSLPGQPYLLNQIIPNFYFHLATTYGILRHNGIDIGKQDFLGRP